MAETIRSLISLLRAHSPFKQMVEQDLAYLLENSVLNYYPTGTVVTAPEDGRAGRFFIVKQGSIRGERNPEGADEAHHAFEIGPGECFPLAALVGDRATRTRHVASSDSFCLSCPRAVFAEVLRRSAPFRDYCLRGVSSLMDEVQREAKSQAQLSLSDQFSLDTRVGDLVQRKPVTCSPETSTLEAIRIMEREGIGSVAIIDETRHPLGIFTLRDIRRVVATDVDALNAPVSEHMARNPEGLQRSATTFEAAMLMARNHFGHALIIDRGKLSGVLSERDLFSLQRVNLVHIARTLANAPTISDLAAMQSEVRKLTETMIAHGATAEQITHLITLLNEYSTRQCIRLCIKEHGDPGVEFSWLCFGSAARREQTLLTDQDNGILFKPGKLTIDDARQKLLPLAEKINQALAQCGFLLCPGNIMASNPKLCLAESEWKDWFSHVIRAATPENLLSSSIFFDLRLQWGDSEAVERVREHLLETIQANALFQRMMAEAALQRRPPLNMFNRFVIRKEGGFEGVDIKKEGIAPFTDAARILALANGIVETGTMERLRALAEVGALEKGDVGAWDEAVQFLQLQRLRGHLDCPKEGRDLSNLISPEHLNDLDSRILKEAFRQCQRLQRKLAFSYQL